MKTTSEHKRKRGRPINEPAYIQMLKILQKKPSTVLELSAKLAMPKRTVYRYIHKADGEGYNIVKLGCNSDSPYTIKSPPTFRR